MRSIADLKRAAKTGAVLDVTNHRYPELSGERTVLKAQTKSLHLTLPVTHPRYGTVDGSWLDIPAASNCTFEDGAVTFHKDGRPFCTVRLADKER